MFAAEGLTVDASDIDLNCDLGEGVGSDPQVIPLITSANVACGFHAGDAATAFATLQLAIRHGVVIGAHPGHPDREHFGRRELARSPERVFEDCVYQIGAMIGLAQAAGGKVRYIKPHGGLFHQVCRSREYAEVIVASAELFQLAVIGLPDSALQETANDRCPFFAEGYADRQYRSDGTLVPRDQPNAFIDDPEQAVLQVQHLIRTKGVRTICVHGDNPKALDFIVALRESLTRSGFRLRPFAA